MTKSKALKNAITSFGGQIIVLILGIIIPRIMIKNYGSDINGLIGTVVQIFTYMALLEAGVGQATRNLLYKPISEHNNTDISYVISVSNRYFRKLAKYYAIGVVILSILVPILIKSNINKSTIILIVLLEGFANVISFYFSQTAITLLTADGRGYVNNVINLLNKIISYAVKIFMALFGIDILFVELAYFCITILKAFYYQNYLKKYYGWINYNAAPNDAKLKDRNSYVITEIAWTIFSSTDMIVLSFLDSTKLASVYTVYNLVFNNIHILLNSVYSSLTYVLGTSYQKDIEKYEKIHDSFTSIFLGIMTILMCVSYILIIPFVQLYTAGVSDIDYIYPSLPLYFALIQILSWSRYVSGNLTAMAGYAKEVSRISLLEATINLIGSLVLMQKYSILGVLIATTIALPIKVMYCIYISDKKVFKRSIIKSIKILGANYFLFATAVVLKSVINLRIENYISLIGYGFLFLFIYSAVGILLNVIVNPHCINLIKALYQNKKLRKEGN